MTESAQHSVEAPSSIFADMKSTIACVICHAVYTPSQSHTYLLQAPPIALESALMNMCHFCFRCRRPACPACWDEVNRVCGECDRDAHLPFRVAALPLPGTLFAPPRRASSQRVYTESPALICVRPGNFQDPISSAVNIDEVMTRPDITTVQAASMPGAVAKDSDSETSRKRNMPARASATRAISPSHARITKGRRVIRRKVSITRTRPEQQTAPPRRKTRVSRVPPGAKALSSSAETSTMNAQSGQSRSADDKHPSKQDISMVKTRPEQKGLAGPRIGRAFIIIAFVLLLTIILIMVAILSGIANTII